MKVVVSVSEDKTEYVKNCLTEHGIEISETAEYMITEASKRKTAAFLSVRNEKKEHMHLSPDEVLYVEAFGKDIEIHTDQETYLSLDRMYELENLLDPQEFLRVSKSVIISRKHVKKIRPSLAMKYVLTLTDGTLIDVTRSYYSDFRRFFRI